MKTGKPLLILLLISALLFASSAPVSVANAQQETRHFFPETGHWVSNAFLVKYNANPMAQNVYGFPITDAFIDSSTGIWIQYFQKARFEFHPENPPELQIVITRLGAILHAMAPGLEQNIPTNTPACHFFMTSGYSVCYDFLKAFDKFGGIGSLGYPISGYEFQEGVLVQYFQMGRMEWHPDLPPGQQILLTDLGKRYFNLMREDPHLLLPNPEDNAITPVQSLRVLTFVAHAVTLTGENQTLFVVVQNQNMQPLQQARVSMQLKFPGQPPVEYILPPTNAHGISKLTFGLFNFPRGLVEIVVTATYDTFIKQSSTSFRIWW